MLKQKRTLKPIILSRHNERDGIRFYSETHPGSYDPYLKMDCMQKKMSIWELANWVYPKVETFRITQNLYNRWLWLLKKEVGRTNSGLDENKAKMSHQN